MTEEIIKQPAASTDAAPVQEAVEEKKRRDRERKRLKRAEQRAKESADQSDEARQAQCEKDWARNLKSQSAAEKELIRVRAEDHFYLTDVLYRSAQRMRAGEAYGSGEVIPLHPERDFAEVQEAIESRKFPVLSPEQEAEGHYYKTFGFKIDGLPELRWNDFIHLFGNFYRQSRNTLTLRYDPQEPFSQPDWSAVEALMSKTKMAGIKANPALHTPAPVAVPPPRRLTEKEQIAKTLEDLNGIGAGEI